MFYILIYEPLVLALVAALIIEVSRYLLNYLSGRKKTTKRKHKKTEITASFRFRHVS